MTTLSGVARSRASRRYLLTGSNPFRGKKAVCHNMRSSEGGRKGRGSRRQDELGRVDHWIGVSGASGGSRSHLGLEPAGIKGVLCCLGRRSRLGIGPPRVAPPRAASRRPFSGHSAARDEAQRSPGYVRADSKTTRMTSQVRRRSEIEKAKSLASIRGWTPVLPRKEATDDSQALRLAFRPTTSQS